MKTSGTCSAAFWRITWPRLTPIGSPLAQLLCGDRSTVLIAEKNVESLIFIIIIFVLELRYPVDSAQIEELTVDSRARGRKLCVSLTNDTINAARSENCREIDLYAREQNQPFYEGLEFEYTRPKLQLKLL
jgi:ribosomal protein S18 acetylase RimI-like enzyme